MLYHAESCADMISAETGMASIKQQVLLAEHCRFRVGGPADYFTCISSLDELEPALDFSREHGLRYFVYGGGSNLFFDDSGFRGLVIQLQGGAYELTPAGNSVRVSAGYDLPLLVRQLAQHDLGGVEFLGNIPGSLGGAVVGNAGCYGRAIADVLTNAEVFDADERRSLVLPSTQLGFAYRHSRLKLETNLIVLSATLKLQPRPCSEVLAELQAELATRLQKHPHEAWCAGSFFKNTSREHPAWRLITEAGVAHAHIGGAALSPLHANFLVNTGGATSADIIALVRQVQDAVRSSSGLLLKPEVRYVSPTGITDL